MARLATLADYKDKVPSEDDDASKRQSYYAGGAGDGGSGTSVYGGKGSKGGAVDRLMAKASHAPSGGGAGGSAGAAAGGAAGGSGGGGSPGTVITFYKNGFTVDDGELRDLESPESKAFLKDIDDGHVPMELIKAGKGKDVTLKDKRSEEYRPPTPPAYVAFSGAGQTMGSTVSDNAVIATAAMTGGKFEVDTCKPTTTLRVTLHTGKRKVLKFNVDHTVGDLLAQVAKETGTSVPFTLKAGFPPKPLEDPSITLKDAGLLNDNVRQELV